MSSTNNKALTPVADTDRVFHWHEHASLWFSLGVGLLVIQIGAYLVPAVGSRDALFAIVLGSIVGSGLLAWTAKLGCDSGLSSAGLMGATFGSHFARLPVILNIVQLIGWTTFELVVMRDGTAAIGKQSLGLDLDGTGYYLKRQSDYLTHTLHSPFGEPTFAREFRNIKRYQKLQIPALQAVFYAERRVDGERRQHGEQHAMKILVRKGSLLVRELFRRAELDFRLLFEDRQNRAV